MKMRVGAVVRSMTTWVDESLEARKPYKRIHPREVVMCLGMLQRSSCYLGIPGSTTRDVAILLTAEGIFELSLKYILEKYFQAIDGENFEDLFLSAPET
jgi:hypothetical protein